MVKQINITLSNKMFYLLAIVVVAIVVSVGVNAFGGNTPDVMGHSLGELDVPVDCLEGEVLRIIDGKWDCDGEPSIDVERIDSNRIYTDMICLGDSDNCISDWPQGTEGGLMGLEHTKEECEKTNEGEVYSDSELGEYSICKFERATCPTGWKKYNSWTTTKDTYCDCLFGTVSTTVIGHDFENKAIETDTLDCSIMFTERYETCTATVTEVGCY